MPSDKFKFFIAVPGMEISADVIENRSLGGSETAGIQLAAELVSQGHQVVVFANTGAVSNWRGVRIEPLGQPNQDCPVGSNFTFRAQIEPHDALIIQRHPQAFNFISNSKVRFWWVHDLARKRYVPAFRGVAWNCQGVLAVSDWHKEQFRSVHGLPSSFLHTIPNGIDLSLFTRAPDAKRKFASKKLVYSSRPERGLANLVEPGGIMEQLAAVAPDVTLLVCGYDHTVPEIEPLYRHLWERCRALPNVELIGSLSKRQMAELFTDATLMVYPIVPRAEHEETSCITLMECQAGGTPFIISDGGAVSETIGIEPWWRGQLVKYQPDGSVNNLAFMHNIFTLLGDEDSYVAMVDACRKHALENYGWTGPAERLASLVGRTLGERSTGVRLVSHLYESGDIALARTLPVEQPTAYIREQAALCRFMDSETSYRAHYDRSAELFHKYNPGLDAAPWNLAGFMQGQPNQSIIQAVAAELAKGPARVLDYGCNIGQLTFALAEQFPQSQFVGVDIAQRNVDTARAQATLRGSTNVEFERADSPMQLPHDPFDIVICAETIEHVLEPPAEFATALEGLCRPGGLTLVSAPASLPDAHQRAPGEEERLEHVRFIDHAEATEFWSSKPGFGASYFPICLNKRTQAVVSGVLYGWRADHKPPKRRDLAAKLKACAPRETIGVLMIVRATDKSVERALASVAPIATEIWCGLDGEAPPWWAELSAKFPQLNTFPLSSSPLTQGFDAARNEVLERITADWVLWLDADETLCYPERLLKYLQPNPFVAYGVAQHHFSSEPPGLLRTDFPCRLFRRSAGLRFYGVVHEHPCYNVTSPPDQVMLLNPKEVFIEHGGYQTEAVRRARFVRNLPLMRRDREVYPERPLGAYLWCRDLIHLARFEMEQTGGRMTQSSAGHCTEALELFKTYLGKGDVYLCLEMLPYVSDATRMLFGPSGGVEFDVGMAAQGKGVGGGQWGLGTNPSVKGYLPDAELAEQFLAMLTRQKLAPMKDAYL